MLPPPRTPERLVKKLFSRELSKSLELSDIGRLIPLANKFATRRRVQKTYVRSVSNS